MDLDERGGECRSRRSRGGENCGWVVINERLAKKQFLKERNWFSLHCGYSRKGPAWGQKAELT